MVTWNFAKLQAEVAKRLIDAPATVIADVPDFINFALRDAQDDANYPIMRAQVNYTTAHNQRLLGIAPSDYKERRGDPYWLDQLGKPVFMWWYPSTEDAIRRYSQEELVGIATPTDVGQPRYLAPVSLQDATMAETAGNYQINVFPLPDNQGFQNTNYTIYFPYWRYLPDLVADADVNWFTNMAPQYIMYQAVGHGFMNDWDEQHAALNFQIADGYKKRLKRKMGNEAASPAKVLAVRSDVYQEKETWRRS